MAEDGTERDPAQFAACPERIQRAIDRQWKGPVDCPSCGADPGEPCIVDPGPLGVALRKLSTARDRVAIETEQNQLSRPTALDALISDAIWSIREEIRGRK